MEKILIIYILCCSHHCSPALVCVHSHLHPLTFAAVARIRWGGHRCRGSCCRFPVCAHSPSRPSSPSPRIRALVPVFVWPLFALPRLCARSHSFVPARLFAHSASVWPLFALVCAHSPRLFVLVPVSFGLCPCPLICVLVPIRLCQPSHSCSCSCLH